MENTRKPSLAYSSMLVLIVVLIISIGMIVFNASIQLMMLIAMLTLIPFVMRLGYSYKDI